MHTQINIPGKSENGLDQHQGDTNTFQKDNPKLLDRVIIDKRGKHYSRNTEESWSEYRYHIHESKIQNEIRQDVQ
ncbi:MAG: hypothetical protein ACYDA4_05950 [Ignavibacteriaceae bacterium]